MDGVSAPATGTAASRREYDAFLAIVDQLRNVPEVAPRPEFSAALRDRLMLLADDVMVPSTDIERRLTLRKSPPRATSSRRRLAEVAAAVVLVGATGGVAAAAQSSLPGSPLYNVKRGLEEVALSLTPSGPSTGRAYFDQADTRLDEVAQAQGSHSSATPDQVRSALRTFTSQSSAGARALFTDYQATGNLADAAVVADFARVADARLVQLRRSAPAGVARDYAAALAQMAILSQQAGVLCPACDDVVPPQSSTVALTSLLSIRPSTPPSSTQQPTARTPVEKPAESTPSTPTRSSGTVAPEPGPVLTGPDTAAIAPLLLRIQQRLGIASQTRTTTGALGLPILPSLGMPTSILRLPSSVLPSSTTSLLPSVPALPLDSDLPVKP